MTCLIFFDHSVEEIGRVIYFWIYVPPCPPPLKPFPSTSLENPLLTTKIPQKSKLFSYMVTVWFWKWGPTLAFATIVWSRFRANIRNAAACPLTFHSTLSPNSPSLCGVAHERRRGRIQGSVKKSHSQRFWLLACLPTGAPRLGSASLSQDNLQRCLVPQTTSRAGTEDTACVWSLPKFWWALQPSISKSGTIFWLLTLP